MVTRTKMEKSKRLRAMAKAMMLSSLIAFSVFAVLEIFGLHDHSRLSILVFFLASFVLSIRFTRNDRFVLWLRHFQARDPRQLRLGILLFRCSDVSIPITLRDSSFSSSPYSAVFRLYSHILFFTAVVVMPLWLVTVMVLFFICAWLNLFSDRLVIPMMIVAFLLSCAPVIAHLYTKRTSLGLAGKYLLNVDSPVPQVDSILNRTLRRAYPFFNSVIIQCPDEIWREVVMFVIDRSSIVLIDVSALTDNLIWEIETALMKKDLEAIIITYGLKPGALEQLPTSIYETIERVVGRNELSRLRVFYYPAEHPPVGWERIQLYWRLSRKLREELLATDFPVN